MFEHQEGTRERGEGNAAVALWYTIISNSKIQSSNVLCLSCDEGFESQIRARNVWRTFPRSLLFEYITESLCTRLVAAEHN